MATIRIATDYPHAAERVWFALTDARALSEWLMPTRDFEPRVGHRFQFRVEPPNSRHTIVDCEVVELVPPRRLAYTWQTDVGRGRRLDTRVSWTLEPVGSGTRLILEHSGFLDTVASFILRTATLRPGWGRMLTRLLPQVLARVNDDGSFDADPVMAAARCR